MAFVDLNRVPSKRDLLVFGFVIAAFFGIVGGLIAMRTGNWRAGSIPWALGAVATTAYAAVPALRWPMFALWMRAAYPMAWLVSHLLLAVIFYGVVTPLGLALRAFGRDPLQRRIDRAAPSYWSRMASPPGTLGYFRQS